MAIWQGRCTACRRIQANRLCSIAHMPPAGQRPHLDEPELAGGVVGAQRLVGVPLLLLLLCHAAGCTSSPVQARLSKLLQLHGKGYEAGRVGGGGGAWWRSGRPAGCSTGSPTP